MGEPVRVLYRNFTPSIVSDEQKGVMSPEISIVDALPEHVSVLKSNLREEDKREVMGLGVSIQQSLWYGYKNSVYRKTALIDSIPVAMWGLCGVLLGGKGLPWLLTSPDVTRLSPLKFARIYQEEVKKMLSMFPILENLVDAEYAAAVRLLDIVGFSIGESEPLGYDGAMYKKFRIERH